MQSENDAILIARARENSDDFSELYNKYFPMVFRYLAARTGDRQLSEDLTSDTFLKAIEKFETYNFEGKPFGAWLFRIAHNLLVDHTRRQKKQKTVDLYETAENIASRENIPEKTNFKLIFNQIEKLLSQFTPEEREILILKLTSDLKFSEIAAILNKNENTIKTKYFRNLKILRNKASHLAILLLLFS